MLVFRSILAVLLAAIAPHVVTAIPGKLLGGSSTRAADKQDGPQNTFFNDIEVPPMNELSGKNFTESISNGYWLVETFSPYCGHCKSLAPKLQKIYEFYYTSDPSYTDDADPTDQTTSFTEYYNFRFAKLDCIAFGSTCMDMDVVMYPTLTLFKDGENIARTTGDLSMKSLSKFIETELEKIKPGSRPIDGPELPGVKATWMKSKKPKLGNNAMKKSSVDDDPSLAIKVKSNEQSTVFMGNVNEQGRSVNLNVENFAQIVTKSTNPWFIKFYAPWCQHCQHMATHWAAMAKEMKGQLNIGEVNCEAEKKLCREMEVDAFPTIVYFKGLERVVYEGGRGLGDFLAFAEKAVESNVGVQDVTAARFEDLEKSEEVIFLYLYDHAITSEDVMALERLSIHIIGYAKIVKSDDPQLAKRFHVYNWPALLVVRSGRATRYNYNTPQTMRNVAKIVNWMKKVRLALVPELTAGSGRELMSGKFLVLAILSRTSSDEFAAYKREIKSAALEWMDKEDVSLQLERQELRDTKQIQIEEAEQSKDDRALRVAKTTRIDVEEIERKEVGFAWVDGAFWEDWIRSSFSISVSDKAAKVVIVDHDNRRYWDQTASKVPLVPSRSLIIETLPKILASPPRLKSKPLGSKAVYYIRQTYLTMSHNFMTMLGLLSCVAVLFIVWRRGRRRSSHMILKGEANHGVGGLLGLSPAQANGKVD